MDTSMEPLTEEHRTAVIDIYNTFVENSYAAYLEQKVDYDYFEKIQDLIEGCPAVVLKTGEGRVVGFGFLHPYRSISTFRRTLELTYFILPDQTRRGLGKRMLDHFIDQARALGVTNLLASISSRNEQSLAFHRKHGFNEVGRLHGIGFKFGQSFDIVWMQRAI